MSRFIQVDQPKTHAGLDRVQNGFAALGDTLRSFNGARGAATLMLAAIVSALLVVANEVVDTWTEGHLMAAWIALWAIGFAALALFSEPIGQATARVRKGLQAWDAARKEAAEDEKLWQLALTDARVMADLSRTMAADARDIRNYY
jgi:hypothetical protein